MPPGSDLDSKRLRSASGERVTRNSRHSLPRNAVCGPATTPQRPDPPAKKRKSEPNSRSQKHVTFDGAVKIKEEIEEPTVSTGQSAKSPKSAKPAKPAANYVKKVRKTRAWHPEAEVYCRDLYRMVATGADLDADCDLLELPDMAHQAQITDNWKPEYSSGNQVLANNGAMPSSEIVEDTEIIEKLVRKKKFDPTDKYIITDPSATYVNSEDHVIVINKHTDPIAYELTRADERYVTNLNSRRRVISRRPYINTQLFTQIMQALEIDSFRRIHNYLLDNLHAVYLKAATFEEDENAECDICRLIDSEEDDMMVFCEMCNTCVHISCSGLQEIPPDEWMCPKCLYTRTPAPPCCLCPVLGGSMTYNEDKSQWAHHACALFMPEIIFINEEERAPFSAYENVSAERFTQVCRVCDTSIGACVTCSWQDCEETHHVGCALRAGLTVSVMEVGDADGNVERRTYCHRHTPEFVFDRRFIDYPSPWVAKMESVFFLMTNYEQIANDLDIEECIVSDVYEYWKIKRIDNSNRPLITNLRDYIKLEPTIKRVAARVEQGLHCKLDGLLYPKGSSDQHHHHFFRRAALMVTEHRQHSLKRVRSNIRKDQKMLTKVVKREIMKREVIRTELEEFEHEMEMARNGMAKDVLKAWKVSPEQIRRAQEPSNFAKFLSTLPQPRPSSSSQNHQKIRKQISPASIPLSKSPLRPRNHPDPTKKTTIAMSPVSPMAPQDVRRSRGLPPPRPGSRRISRGSLPPPPRPAASPEDPLNQDPNIIIIDLVTPRGTPNTSPTRPTSSTTSEHPETTASERSERSDTSFESTQGSDVSYVLDDDEEEEL